MFGKSRSLNVVGLVLAFAFATLPLLSSAVQASTSLQPTHRVTVFTANLPNAGTDAQISIWLYGQTASGSYQWFGSTPGFPLSGRASFEAGSIRGGYDLPVTGMVGLPIRIFISKSGGSPWCLEKVVVHEWKTGISAAFAYRNNQGPCWIGGTSSDYPYDGDGRSWRYLPE